MRWLISITVMLFLLLGALHYAWLWIAVVTVPICLYHIIGHEQQQARIATIQAIREAVETLPLEE